MKNVSASIVKVAIIDVIIASTLNPQCFGFLRVGDTSSSLFYSYLHYRIKNLPFGSF
jgi:hypothetical protein